MLDLNPEKYLSLIAKYKMQSMFALVFVLMLVMFFIGRATVVCPSKEVVCKSELVTIKNLFEEVEKCQAACTSKIRSQIDIDDVDCRLRIRKAISKNKSTADIVSCEEAKAIMPQCKSKGKWK